MYDLTGVLMSEKSKY